MNHVTIYARKSTESEDRQIMSIDSQIKELKEHAKKMNWKISSVYTESKSAKAPGREIFNQMYKEIQDGSIQELLCWKLDRLARNPIDGGALIWALEEKRLTNIHTPQSTFSNSGNDKFWIQMEFGMAKKYVDDLSDNVKRGLKSKLETGWYPSKAPFGYKNNREDHTIIPDPDLFHIIRKMWDLILFKKLTPMQVLRFILENKRYRDKLHYSKNGRPIARSTIFTMFGNPFYYGMFLYNGKLYPGKHTPMITKAEFDDVQHSLDRGYSTRPKSYEFAYTGLIKCGECGASITAEHKTNRRYGYTYTYYHCTKKLGSCSQRSIEEKPLAKQANEFIKLLSIDEDIYQLLLDIIERQKEDTMKTNRSLLLSLESEMSSIKNSLARLLTMRLDNLITDSEYLTKKQNLEEEKEQIERRLNVINHDTEFVNDKTTKTFSFARQLSETFDNGSIDDKKRILQETGSNLFLRDKKLLIQAKTPFDAIRNHSVGLKAENSRLESSLNSINTTQNVTRSEGGSALLALVDDVRTFYQESLAYH